MGLLCVCQKPVEITHEWGLGTNNSINFPKEKFDGKTYKFIRIKCYPWCSRRTYIVYINLLSAQLGIIVATIK